jgi:hypothetical protein
MDKYTIRVRGHLSEAYLTLFAGLTAVLLPGGETMLVGLVQDQAALHGILRQVHDLGLVLVQVQQEAGPDSDAATSH